MARGPSRRSRVGIAKRGTPGSALAARQIGAWAGDSGASASASATGMGVRAVGGVSRRARSTAEARPATVGDSNRAASGKSTPKASHSRAMTRAASREWPPSAKKLSSLPTSGSPRTSATTPLTSSSAGVRGCVLVCASVSARDSAAASTLPPGVTGNVSSSTMAAGSMWGGSLSSSQRRSPSTGGAT